MIRPVNTIEQVLLYSQPVWERNVFVMWYKRLETERFLWPDKQGDVVTLNGQQLNWLLDGYDIRRLHPHQTISPLSML